MEKRIGFYPDLEILDEVRIGSHEAIRSGYKNGRYCRNLIGWVTSIHFINQKETSAMIQCEGCEFSTQVIIRDGEVTEVSP